MIDDFFRTIPFSEVSSFDTIRSSIEMCTNQMASSNFDYHSYPLRNQTNEIPFDPREWLVTDQTTGKHRAPRQYEFLLLLLRHPNYTSYIVWLDQSQGIFKITKPKDVAALWGRVKHRQTIGLMDYETFTRGIRFQYKSGKMIKTHRKHTFRFKLPFDNWI